MFNSMMVHLVCLKKEVTLPSTTKVATLGSQVGRQHWLIQRVLMWMKVWEYSSQIISQSTEPEKMFQLLKLSFRKR